MSAGNFQLSSNPNQFLAQETRLNLFWILVYCLLNYVLITYSDLDFAVDLEVYVQNRKFVSVGGISWNLVDVTFWGEEAEVGGGREKAFSPRSNPMDDPENATRKNN